MSREKILQRIRLATAGSTPVEQPESIPAFPAFADPVETFRRMLEAAGGKFFSASGGGGLSAVLTEILRENSATELYWDSRETLLKHGLSFHVRQPEAFSQGFLTYSVHLRGQVQFPLTLRVKPFQREQLSSLVISASSAWRGIAETGSVVHRVGSGNGRLLPVAAEAHVALLSRADLVPNHADFFNTLRLGEESSMLTLITGPSRTADIEKMLVVGVHGPKRHYVILTG